MRTAAKSGRAQAALRRRIWSEETAIRLVRNRFVETWSVPLSFDELKTDQTLNPRTLYGLAPNGATLALLARLPLSAHDNKVASIIVDRSLENSVPNDVVTAQHHYAHGLLADGVKTDQAHESLRHARKVFENDEERHTSKHWALRSRLASHMLTRQGEYFWCKPPMGAEKLLDSQALQEDCDRVGSLNIAAQVAGIRLVELSYHPETREIDLIRGCIELERRLDERVGTKNDKNAVLRLTPSGFEARLRLVYATHRFAADHSSKLDAANTSESYGDSSTVSDLCLQALNALHSDYERADALTRKWIDTASVATGHKQLPAGEDAVEEILGDPGLVKHLPRLPLMLADSMAAAAFRSDSGHAESTENARALWFAIEENSPVWARAVACSRHAQFELDLSERAYPAHFLTQMGLLASKETSGAFALDDEDKLTQQLLEELSTRLNNMPSERTEDSEEAILRVIDDLENALARQEEPPSRLVDRRLKNLVSAQDTIKRLASSAEST